VLTPVVVVSVVALLVACSSSTSGPSVNAPSVKALGAKYLAIAVPANKKLDHDFDAFTDAAHDDLATATAQLTAVAKVERAFDKDLTALHLPKPYATTAAALIAVNELRATLTERAATSSDLTQLHAFQPQLDAMNARLEVQVKVLRKQLDLPPPATS